MLIGIRSDGAGGAGGFSGVGVGTQACLTGVGTGRATFADRVRSKAKFVGVSTGRAGLAGGLRILIGVGADGAWFAIVAVLETSCSATAGGRVGGAVHAGSGGCVADAGAADAGGGVGSSAVSNVAGGNPGGVGGCLAFVFGEVADEAGGRRAGGGAAEAGTGVGGGAVGGSARGSGQAYAVLGITVACIC